MNLQYLQGLLPRLPAGVSEVYFHPAAPHAKRLASSEAAPPEATDVEAAALFSTAFVSALEGQGIRPVTYAEAQQLAVQ
jgi:hypothetical protein